MTKIINIFSTYFFDVGVLLRSKDVEFAVNMTTIFVNWATSGTAGCYGQVAMVTVSHY